MKVPPLFKTNSSTNGVASLRRGSPYCMGEQWRVVDWTAVTVLLGPEPSQYVCIETPSLPQRGGGVAVGGGRGEAATDKSMGIHSHRIQTPPTP